MTKSIHPDQTPPPLALCALKKTGVLVSGCLATFAVIFTVLFVLIFDFKAEHPSAQILNGHEFNQTTNFIRRVSKKIIGSTQTTTIKASKKELRSTLIFTERSQLGMSGSVDMMNQKADFSISLKLPLQLPFKIPVYLNSEFTLVESTNGIRLSNSRIGNIRLKEEWANRLVNLSLERALGAEYATRVIQGIHDLKIDPRQLSFRFTPIGNPQKDFAQAAQRLGQYTGQHIQLQQERLQHYIDHIFHFNNQLMTKEVSLSELITLVILEAKQQTGKGYYPAHEENLHALYALAIQSSPDLFASFVPDIDVGTLIKSKHYKPTLNKRTDLAKHFITSLGLHILAEQGISFSIGEAKELIDSIKGGSGFSFADLAADRCGIAFSKLAISKNLAATLQALSEHTLNEEDFFPSIDQLPEGLSEAAFKQRFSDTESEAYRAIIKEIDHRIKNTAIFMAISKA